jgi:uncharacterized membrane protein HdeD (DUF308 family)
MKSPGIILVIIGIVALAYGLIGFDRKSTLLDVGGIKATATEHKTSPVAAVLGIISLVAGVALLVGSKRGT